MIAEKFLQVIDEASAIVLDKKPEVKLALTCIIAHGHLLIEDLPGVGKTTLVQTLGKLLGLKTSRIQFTVDLLPADILGATIYLPKDEKFEFHPGPIFAQMVLGDELNRASPRTQSALLQSLEEREVTVDGKNWKLPEPFIFIATQNPHQQMGTFPLPESQLDRFLLSLELLFATPQTEIRLFKEGDPRELIRDLKPLITIEEILQAQKEALKATVSDVVAKYVSDILTNSRRLSRDQIPLSTRAGLSLIRAAKAWAFLDKRNFLRAEDVQAVFVPVLGHRLGGNHGLRRGRELAEKLKLETAVPV
jgi:MoxR-like ATPase